MFKKAKKEVAETQLMLGSAEEKTNAERVEPVAALPEPKQKRQINIKRVYRLHKLEDWKV